MSTFTPVADGATRIAQAAVDTGADQTSAWDAALGTARSEADQSSPSPTANDRPPTTPQFNGANEQFSRGERTDQDAGRFSYERTVVGSPMHEGGELKFGDRSNQTFNSSEDASAYARSLKGEGAAVVAENGQYAVYKLQGTHWYESNFDVDRVAPRSAFGGNTQVFGADANVRALVTGDGYVVDLGGAKPEVELSGSARDPFIAHTETFGSGLQKLSGNRERFERQFELGMRDTAFAALKNSEDGANAALSRLQGKGFTAEDKAALARTQERLAPVDTRILEKRRELSSAQDEAQDAASGMVEPGEMGFAVPGASERYAEATAKVERTKAELSQLQGERIQAAREFPLLLRVDPKNMADFNGKTEEKKVEFFRGEAKDVLADIRTTRDNLKAGKLNLWTMDGIRNTTAAGLGVKGDQLKWVEDRAKHEQRVETAWKIGEGVLAVGLAVGAAFFTGGTSLALLGASSAIGLHSAVDTTAQYFQTNAAANTNLDPNAGLIPPEMKGHWGWVAASWIGVGLDATAVSAGIKALRAGAQLSQVAKSLNVDAKVLETATKAAETSTLTTHVMSSAEFTAQFGNDSAQAATVLRAGKNGAIEVEIVSRAELSQAERQAALAEEFAHLQQLGDPAMRGKMLKLSEENLSGWQRMQPGEKLDVYRTKLEVEADAQRRLIEHGGPGANKAAAREHLGAIESRLSEISNPRNAERTARQLAEAEPPRLFSKKTRIETFTAPGSGKSIEAATEGNAIVPLDKVSIYMRGKISSSGEEFRALKEMRQTSRKAFDADPANARRLKQLEKEKHNYDRSQGMKKVLEDAGLSDTTENNELLTKHLLQAGQEITADNARDFASVIKAPHGEIKVLSTWKILPDGRVYLSTVKVIPKTAVKE